MIRKPLLFLFLTLIFSSQIFAQSLVNVNPLTGTASASIPLYNLSYGGVNVPVTLSYSTNGVKPTDVEANAGMGWWLTCGGQISRTPRGLPDDCTKDWSGNRRVGWMYNSNQTATSSFAISNNGSTCSNETTDISYITTHFGNFSDTEPDIFNVSAPGLSCQLVYDHSINNFRPLTYQDLKITYTIKSDSTIGSFTIINDKGVTYVFAAGEEASILTSNPASPINYFANFYNQYEGGIVYTDNWYLTSITDVNQQGVVFHYHSKSGRSGSDSTRLYLGGASNPSLQYVTHSTVWPEQLDSVSLIDGDVYRPAITMAWDTTGVSATGQSVISSISGRGRTINFSYLQSLYIVDGSNFSKAFLRRVYDNGCSSPFDYSFSYAGETPVYSEGSVIHYTTALADSSSRKFDYWGYNSSNAETIPKLYVDPSDTTYRTYAIAAGSTPGSSYLYNVGVSAAVVDTINVIYGALDTIKYESGGMTTLTYQSNDYLDVPSNTIIKGGGIRVKQVIDHDGINEANDIIRNYSYVNPATGTSSGKPLSLPSYGFIIPYSGSATGQTLWTDASAISSADLSPEDHSIVYGYVKESTTHAGSVLYQYYLPATNWDKTATPACSGCSTVDWRPTMDYIGRTSCTATYGPVKNSAGGYPFLPNANYDFERGLPQSVIAYNDAGSKVKETDYTYQRSYASVTAVPALHFDYDGGSSGVMGYDKYNVYTNTSELTSKVVNTVYDSPTLTQAQTSTVNYTYGSAYHKLLTKESTTNSDGTVLINNFMYVKDYAATSSTNGNINALYNLALENANITVETWSQVQSGGNTYTTAAGLTLFNAHGTFNGNAYLPSQQYKLSLPNGETNFIPFYFSGTTINKDAGYQTIPAINFDAYDGEGTLLTADDGRHHVVTTVVDHVSEKPIVSAKNAAYNEFAFADFNGTVPTMVNIFTVSGGTSTYVTGHSGQGITFSSSQTLSSPSVTKNAQAANYIFSTWINSGTNTGSITLTLSLNIGGTINTYAKTFTGPGNNWKYFEWKLPVSGTAFTLSVTSSANISVDDVFFYPETAEVTSYSYDPITHFPASVTNTNGISSYYVYDVWGRKLYTYDRFKNITEKNTYITKSTDQSFAALSINGGGNVNQNSSFILNVMLTGCATGLYNTYTWNFGDGSSPVTTTSPYAPAHTYDTVKTYNPTVQVVSPIYGTETLSTSVNVQTPPPTNVTLSYVWSSGLAASNVSRIDFYQGGTLKYSFGYSAISGATVLSGTYNINVVMSATASGYGSISFFGCSSLCQNFVMNKAYTFSFNNVVLSSGCGGLQLQQNTSACTGEE